MLRYSVDPGPQRENMCAVYALFGVVLIPISFLAIRLSQTLIHPTSSRRTGRRCGHSMFLTFCVCLAAMIVALRDALPARARRASASTRACASCSGARSRDVPSGEVHRRAAYLVVFVGAARVRADHRGEAPAARARGRGASSSSPGSGRPTMLELLFWPALIGYGEAAFAYSSPRFTRWATWGVRVGWLRADGAARGAGRAHRRLPVVDLGGLAQPLRLARRRHVPRSGAAGRATGCSVSR